MYTKEQILDEIKRVAESMGVTSLKQEDFLKNSTLPMSTVKFYLGSWKQAVEEAGLRLLEGGKIKDKADDDELLLDLIRLYNESGEAPSLSLIREKGRFGEQLYHKRWKSTSEAFLEARKKFAHKILIPGQSVRSFESEELGEDRIDRVLSQAADDEGDDLSRLLYDRLGIGHPPKDKQAQAEVKVPKPEELEEVDPNEITREQTIDPFTFVERKPVAPDLESMFSDTDSFTPQDVDRAMRVPGKEEERGKPAKTVDKTVKTEARERESRGERAAEVTVSFPQGNREEMTGNQGIKYIPQTIKPSQAKKKPKWVGELLNFRGLRFAPLNQHGVIYLFGMISQELGFIIEAIRPGFPAAEGKRCVDKEKNRWEHVRIEFEFRSSFFRERGHDDDECDLIVCWHHDWEDCPVEVLELNSTIKYLAGQDGM